MTNEEATKIVLGAFRDSMFAYPCNDEQQESFIQGRLSGLFEHIEVVAHTDVEPRYVDVTVALGDVKHNTVVGIDILEAYAAEVYHKLTAAAND